MARTVDPKRKKVAESEKNLRLAQKELAKIKVCIACPVVSYSNDLLGLLCFAIRESAPLGQLVVAILFVKTNDMSHSCTSMPDCFQEPHVK